MFSKPSILRTRLKESTTQEILIAAEQVMVAVGAEATSMTQIAKVAGVSVGTLYNYFKDKKELLKHLVTIRRQQFYEKIDSVIALHQADPFELQLEMVVHTIFNISDERLKYLRIFFDKDTGSLLLKDKQNSQHQPLLQLIDRLRPIMVKGVKEGSISKANSQLFAPILAGMIRGVMIECLADEEQSFKDAASGLLNVFLNGTRNGK